MTRISRSATWARPGAAIVATLLALALAPAAFAQSKAELAQACADAAHQWFENFDAPTSMRTDDPRVDGTRTAGGTIDLGNYVAEIRCGFPAKKFRLTEFYVDGVNKLKALQSGKTYRN